MKPRSRSYWFVAITVLAAVGFFLSSFKTRRAIAQVGDGIIQMSALRHNTFDSNYRMPFGALPAGATVRLSFRTAVDDVQTVTLFYYQFDPATGANTPNSPISFPMTFSGNRIEGGTMYSFWEYNLATPNTPAILYYKFKITDAGTTAYYSDSYADDNDNLNQGGDGAPSTFEPFPAFQLTVYDPNFQTPTWLQNANVYQIFPDRFRNGDKTTDYGVPGSTSGSPVFYGSQPVIAHTTWNEAILDPRQPGPYAGSYGNQFFGGDLKGIQDTLDYLQSLGFDTIYLTPIFQARSNHRYDTDNYLTVDPALGGDAALASLVTAMSQRGMHLILDGVFNHASSDGLYFDRYHRYGPPDGACESLTSPYRTWFLFNTNNVPCGSNDYTGWSGFDGLPRFDKSNDGYRDFIYRSAADNVVKHWYDRGASGWRFDVADDSDLRKIWHEFRPYAKGYKADGPLVGEIWPDASQYLAGDQMDSVMNYRFRKNVLGFARGAADWVDTNNNGVNTIVALKPSQFDHALRAVREDYPPQATSAMLNLLDSHDTNRALFVLTESGDTGLQQAKERLRLAALFQFTYLGAPMVYYGDEVAINAPGKTDNNGVLQNDPYNRAPYPWNDETGDSTVYGPADGDMLAYYSALANLRKQHPALRTGDFETLLTGDTSSATTDDDTFAFARVDPTETSIVALNNGAVTDTATIPVNSYFSDGTVLQDAISSTTQTVANGSVTITLPARTGVVMFAQATPTATPTPTPTPAATPTQWTLIWSDEFNGSGSVNGNDWIYDLGTGYAGSGCPANWGTGEVEVMSSSTDNVFQSNGNLNIGALHSGGSPTAGWTSGRIETVRTDFQPPAAGAMAVEARLQQPNVDTTNGLGYWPAFWMLGAPFRGNCPSWPSIGEIDIMEDINGRSSEFATLHCGSSPGGQCNEPTGLTSGERACPTCQTAFHTYRVELDKSVTPEEIRWYLDGTNFFTLRSDQVDATTWNNATNHGFFIIFDVAIGGGFPAAFGGGPTAATISGQSLVVDYVRVFYSSTPMPTPTPTPIPLTVQFSSPTYSVGEGDGHVTISVTRSGDTSGAATVDYHTADTDTFTVGCADTVNNHGSAYARCDFATVVGTLTWDAGDASPKSFDVPIIDDAFAEGSETFFVVLSNPTGATLGSPAMATVTIVDNDIVNGPNPILQTNAAGVSFFVRQHYLDFLGREPEAGQPWSAILLGCADQFNTDPNSPSAGCDRITVSGAFFGSPEFKDKGFYVIDFYRVAFGRLPLYSEFTTDLASLVGTTAQEVFARRAAFANNFVQRPEFASIAALPNSSYVMTLMAGTNGQNYNLTSITTPDPANPDGTTKVTLTRNDLINALNANTLTKAQVLRAIVQSDEIINIEAVSTFVASQYYGYLRRTPDTAGFNSWVNYLTTHPTDFRTMVNGFMNSIEYRLRFGPAQ